MTNVSVNEYFEPTILLPEQPILIADPPDHTPPRPPTSRPPLRTYRLTVIFSWLSERKGIRDHMCKWKRETEAKRESELTSETEKYESTHEGRYTGRSTAAHEASRESACNKG